MLKKFLILLALGIIQAIPMMAFDDLSVSSNKTIYLKPTDMEYGNETEYLKFQFQSESEADYYIRFWAFPVNTLPKPSKCSVIVNEVPVGNLQFNGSGWQSCGIEKVNRISLKKGANTIRLTYGNNLIPSVESICLSPNMTACVFDESSYQNFIKDAELANAGIQSISYRNEEPTISYSLNSGEINCTMPLTYTFFTNMSFNKGDTLKINSSSKIDHDIDLFIIGRRMFSLSDNFNNEENHDGGMSKESSIGSSGTVINPGYWQKTTYQSVPDSIATRLNWHASSQSESGETLPHKAELKATIPYTGVYMIRVKCNSSDWSGTANLLINDNVEYADVPISMYRVSSSMFRPGVKYKFETSDFGNGDPMLFIDSFRGSRIISYDDDGGTGLGCKLEREFQYIPYGLQLSSFASLNPQVNCKLNVTCVDESTNSSNKTKSISEKGTDLAAISDVNLGSKIQLEPKSPHLGDVVKITSSEKIKTVNVFNTEGKMLLSQSSNDYETEIQTSEIDVAGIMLFDIATEDCHYIEKLIIKK